MFRSNKPNYRYRKERGRSARGGMVGRKRNWRMSKRNSRMKFVQFYQSYLIAISYLWLTLVIGKIGLSQYVYLWPSGAEVKLRFIDDILRLKVPGIFFCPDLCLYSNLWETELFWISSEIVMGRSNFFSLRNSYLLYLMFSERLSWILVKEGGFS